MEIGSGHHWLAHRVPHDAFFVTGNQGRFKASMHGLSQCGVGNLGLQRQGTGVCFQFAAGAAPVQCRSGCAAQLRRWGQCCVAWFRPACTSCAWLPTHCQQEGNLSDAASVLHSTGLLSFAAAAGLCRSASCHPFSWFDAFMSNNAGDQVRSCGSREFRTYTLSASAKVELA